MRTLARAAALPAAVTVALLTLAPNATATTASVTSATTAPASPALVRAADRIMALPVERFVTVEHVAPFDWSTDGCSVPGEAVPYKKLFTPACTQHDFGYRNYGSRAGTLALDPTPARKAAIDARFLEEMRRICDRERPGPIRHTACYGAARTYYDAVRIAGDPAFYA
ncbi:phospholipase A2 [Streptomyces sp. B-S-A8]|uniref:Phospholipase A2 n=1 Tax=Streptomyces solicavernae TaxID=3043614 RepID=A0ABT6RUY7_9ACTN|nr:phospholipase A2 [Streptomyces sp. B-S-A8]MDI3388244.1 phospholipase A2 [Streptomyces sp. B-S-A8]